MELNVEKKLYLFSTKENKKIVFIQNLIKLFNIPIHPITDVTELTQLNLNDLIILWDFDTISIATNFINNHAHSKHILFNVERGAIDECHLLSTGFQGVLYEDDSAPLIIKGINWVGNDQLWFSRKALSQLAVDLLQSKNESEPKFCRVTFERFTTLTAQESLIINRLIDGYKNKEIADDFSISEHTVKSHLYSIYKKIKVRNRVHAINLARKFMPLLQSNSVQFKLS